MLLTGRALALDPAKDLTEYNCQTWSRQNGLMVNAVYGIAQTEDGYVWLGTSSGLVRFDGTGFTMLRPPKSGNNIVTTLAAAREGGLWAGLENNTVSFYDGTGWPTNRVMPTLKADWSNRSLQVDKDGSLIVVSAKQLVWLPPTGRFRPLLSLTYEHDPNVMCGFRDSQGRFWYGTADGVASYWQAGTVHPLAAPELAGQLIFTMTEDHQGNLWLGTSGGLYCYDAGLHRQSIPAFGTEVKALMVDRQGVLWIGSSTQGLLRYRGGKYEYFRKTDGLASDAVLSLAEDREGSLWVGTGNGVSQLTDVKFPICAASENQGLTAVSVCASRLGGIWVGNTMGVAYLNDQPKNYGLAAGLTNNFVKRVWEARNGDLYLILTANDMLVFSHEKIMARYATTNKMESLAEDNQGVIVSCGGGLCRVGTNYFTPYVFTNAIPPPFYWILNLAPGRDGVIWVASVNGLFRVKDGSYQQWTMAQGLSSVRVESVCEDSEGVVWAAMSAGIARLKNNQIKCISENDGLFDNNVYAIVPDDLGNLWVDAGRGVSRISRQNLNDFADGRTEHVECKAYDGLESVKPTDKTYQEKVGCKSLDGRIWFPNPNGVVVINPRQIPINQVIMPVHIQTIRANGREYAPVGTIVVPPGHGELALGYAALTFIAPQKIQYRCRLEGYEPGWEEADSRHMAVYTNLKPGRYLFHVIAANADGVWNQAGDSVAIELRPHYYQTDWFYGGCAVLLFAGLAGGYGGVVRGMRHKAQRLQESQDRLEREVNLRTRELSYERDLLQALMDSSPDHIYFKDRQSRFIKACNAQAKRSGLTSADAMLGKTDFDYFTGEHARPAYDDEQEIIRTGRPITGKLEKETWPDGRVTWVLTNKMPLHSKDGQIIGTFGISKDITALKQAEARVEEIHKQLLDTSRQAGMAEVATNVLHNVGNVLNSVNVSASVVLDNTKKSQLPYLGKVVALLEEHAADLGGFLTRDSRGQELPAFLGRLAGQLAREQAQVISELEMLREHIEHIKEVVAMQQSYAKISGVVETVQMAELVEDALRMNIGALDRHRIQLVRDFQDLPPVTVEKHKILQILVNLIRNAKYACDESGRTDKVITLQLAPAEHGVRIAVIDNGVGIPPEIQARLFDHGFTTRKGGHGFGLHSGALTARELGGSLTAFSAGCGQGATFTLLLPLQPPKAEP